MKKCPFCGSRIEDDVIKCRHCGEWLTEQKGLNLCPNCRAPKKEADFCRTCGWEFESNQVKYIQCNICGYWSSTDDKVCQNTHCRNILKREAVKIDKETLKEFKEPFSRLTWLLILFAACFIFLFLSIGFEFYNGGEFLFYIILASFIGISIYTFRCSDILYSNLRNTEMRPWLWLLFHIVFSIATWGLGTIIMPLVVIYKYVKLQKA